MPKRVRGSATRPGQRPRLQRSAPPRPRPADAEGSSLAPPSSLTDAEEARAAQLEAAIVAAERATPASAPRGRPTRSTDAEPRVRQGSIAVRAGEEYAYVSRDVRRITLIGGSLIALVIGIWAVVQATGVGPF